MKKYAQTKFYELLRKHAESQEELTDAEIEAVTGWPVSTFRNTYYTKQYSEFMTRNGDRYIVGSHFLRVSLEEFLAHITQSRTFYGAYERYTYERLVTYEFLLPLTREDKLRQALDELFFRETVLQRLSEIDQADLDRVIPLEPGESKEAYADRIVQEISDLFGGYSIQHVSGRFRASHIVTKDAAVKFERDSGKKYLHDETTAVVRFIVRCETTRTKHGSEIKYDKIAGPKNDKGKNEIEKVRVLFFEFFVEAVVRSVRGEEEIWLTEESDTKRLFVFEKATGK